MASALEESQKFETPKVQVLDQILVLKKLEKQGKITDSQYHEAKQKLVESQNYDIIKLYKEISEKNKNKNLIQYFNFSAIIKKVFNLQLLLLIFWCLLLFLIYRSWFKSAAVVLLLVAALGLLLLYNLKSKNQEEGFVSADTTEVYLGPGQNYPTIDMLKFLDEVIVLEKKSDWFKIRYDDHYNGRHNVHYGWVVSNSITKVPSI